MAILTFGACIGSACLCPEWSWAIGSAGAAAAAGCLEALMLAILSRMEDIRLCETWSLLWTLGPEPPMDGALGAMACGAIACGAAAAMVCWALIAGGAIMAGWAIAAGLLVLCLVLAVLPTDADPSTRPS